MDLHERRSHFDRTIIIVSRDSSNGPSLNVSPVARIASSIGAVKVLECDDGRNIYLHEQQTKEEIVALGHALNKYVWKLLLHPRSLI